MTVYRFKSRETKDLVMMEREARRILDLLSKDLQAGIIQPDEMAGAAKTLTDAAKNEERELNSATASSSSPSNSPSDSTYESGEDAPMDEEAPIGLTKRIAPFLEMLKRCEAAQVPVVWGV